MNNKEEEKIVEKIIERIDYVLGGINQISTRQADLLTAKTVRALSEAYKNLRDAGGKR